MNSKVCDPNSFPQDLSQTCHPFPALHCLTTPVDFSVFQSRDLLLAIKQEREMEMGGLLKE